MSSRWRLLTVTSSHLTTNNERRLCCVFHPGTKVSCTVSGFMAAGVHLLSQRQEMAEFVSVSLGNTTEGKKRKAKREAQTPKL